MNLLKETEEFLKELNTSLDNVIISCNKGIITKENFIEVANVEYNNGYGNVEVPLDLQLEDKDFICVRYEYDGNENWVVIPKPDYEMPTIHIDTLTRSEYYRKNGSSKYIKENLKVEDINNV